MSEPMRSEELVLVPDDGDTIRVLPDSRDLYKVRGLAESKGWPSDFTADPIRSTYAIAWMACRRTNAIDPHLAFDAFVDLYRIDFDAARTFDVDPTNPAESVG